MDAIAPLLESVLAPTVGAGIVALSLWRAQVRRERRDRTVDLYLHFEGEQMKADRGRCWDFLDEAGEAVGPLSRWVPSSEGRVLDFRACLSVLTFYALVQRLIDAHQIDRGLTRTLFEHSRANFARHFASMRAAPEPVERYQELQALLDRPIVRGAIRRGV